jgi:predicted Zn-dependent peptidase
MRIKTISFTFLLFLILLLSSLSNNSIASQYTPKDLYNPEYFILDNGMSVVLKKRDVTHNVAMRLSVNVGFIDFACSQKELPHFLEHLLFTGTSKYSETELRAFIEENGGWWNAETDYEETVYKIDIYSPSTLFALDLLYEIITDSDITPENVELSRDIIHRESGGKPSALRQWLYRHGIGRNAYINALLKMFPGTYVFCPDLQTAEDITREDIMNTYNQYYIPNNMLLVVVGEFDREDLVKKIQTTFGSLQREELNGPQRTIPGYYESGPSKFTGTFSPVVDSDAEIAFLFRTDGNLSPDLYAFSVLEIYLNNRMYEKLRIDTGMSYSPQSYHANWDRYGLFGFGGDVDINKIAPALKILMSETEALKNGDLEPDDLEKTKQKILLALAQGYEANSDIADYYVLHGHELKAQGKFINHADRIERVSIDDMREIVSRYFTDERSVIVKSRPTLTFTQLYILIGFIILTVGLIGWRVIVRIRRH